MTAIQAPKPKTADVEAKFLCCGQTESVGDGDQYIFTSASCLKPEARIVARRLKYFGEGLGKGKQDSLKQDLCVCFCERGTLARIRKERKRGL